MSEHETSPEAVAGHASRPADAAHVIALVEEMIGIVVAENRELARGLPASLSAQVARKTELAEALDACVGSIHDHHRILAAANQDLQVRLFERSGELRAAIDENVVRLRAAIEANRRRVDAVMRAIREQLARDAAYQANGRRGGSGAHRSNMRSGVVA